MKSYPKPLYKLEDKIVGRTHHLGENLPNIIVMVEIDSARYDSIYGHWIYCGTVWHIDNGVAVEIYEHDVIKKL